MKAITRGLIEKHLGDEHNIRRRVLGGWFIALESGASVTITRRRIDFGKYRYLENRANVEEWLFQEEVNACLALGQDIWGGIRVFGEGSNEDRAAMLRFAESGGIETGDQGLVLRHFGPDAAIKYSRHGWKVSLPDASCVKVTGSAIEEVRGSAEVLRGALMLLHEIAPGQVVVRGKPELILMVVQVGKSLNIEVIPEGDLAMFYTVTAAIAQTSCIALACMRLELWQAVIAGYIAGMALCVIGGRIFWKQIRAAARKRGLEIKGLDPTINTVRKATIDDARSRGML